MLMPVPAVYAVGSMTLLLLPHCTEQTNCPEYAVADAEHFITNQLATGDILDLDVVVRGSDYAGVRSVASWISYDPKVLEARSIDMLPDILSPTPGEQTIDASQGIVKIGGNTTSGLQSPSARIARVTFRVLQAARNTELSFADFSAEGTGHTAVNGIRQGDDGDAEAPLLWGNPAKLTVKLTADTQPAAGGTVSSTLSTSSMSSSAAPVGTAGSSFGILQVQEVRVTTKDTVIFLGWQALKSSELVGYNVYYGTVSGRYIQRRSLPASSASLVLRDLEPGSTYFLAVRGVNAQDQETVFSQEVSVTVGQPETSTAPMTRLPVDTGSVTGNPIDTRGGTTINGETGSASMFLWILLGSACIGTAFAFRRQLVLFSHGS